jgi:uncharacterized protein (TIGR03435 family)
MAFGTQVMIMVFRLMTIAIMSSQAIALQNPDSSGSDSPPIPAFTQSTQASKAQTPTFEVASVRISPPGGGFTSISDWGTPRFSATNATFQLLLEIAFNVSENYIVRAPSWFESQKYNIDAKVEGDRGLTHEEMMPLLQQLLEDRFHLAVHREMKDFPGYALVVAKNGPKLRPSKEISGHGQIESDRLLCPGCSLGALAGMLARVTGRPIADKTGIKGTYDIKLEYAPNDATDSPLASIFTALQEQQGLKLIPQKVPVEILAIDHAERVPTEN